MAAKAREAVSFCACKTFFEVTAEPREQLIRHFEGIRAKQ